MVFDKHLKKYLKKTGSPFKLEYSTEQKLWQISLAEKTITAEKLQDGLRKIWLEIENPTDLGNAPDDEDD